MRIVLVGTVLLAPLVCTAEPLVTISCDSPKETTQEYGVRMSDRATDTPGHEPQNHLTAPEQDGYNARPTFVLDSNRKKLTMLWAESAGEKEMRGLSKRLGHDWKPDPAREIRVIDVSSDVITALDAHPGRNGIVALYSLYPKLGVLFLSQHYTYADGRNASQQAFFAKCEFSWSGKP